MTSDTITFRKHFPGLSRFTDKDLTVFLESLEIMEYPAGAVFMAPGYGSGSMFFVDQGSVEVALESGQLPIVIGELKVGSWFGEMALIDPAPASARVTTLTDCTLLVLKNDAFNKLRRANPGVSGKLLQVINEGLAQRLHNTIKHIDGLQIAAEGNASPEDKKSWFTELARRVFGPVAKGRQ